MANPWFRMYSEFASDPKVQSMSEVMQRRLLMLFCLRCSNVLATLQPDELAFALHISIDELSDAKTLFLQKGFIDDQWNLINWDKRQFNSDSSTARSRKHREAKKEFSKNSNVGATLRNVAATPPDTDTDTDIKPPTPLRGADVRFDRFWSAYPRKKAKDAARKAWAKRRPDDSMLASMLAAIAVQSKSAQWLKDGGQFVPYPATWLNDGCWQDDEPVGSESSVGGYV